jgi:hypothetical protein
VHHGVGRLQVPGELLGGVHSPHEPRRSAGNWPAALRGAAWRTLSLAGPLLITILQLAYVGPHYRCNQPGLRDECASKPWLALLLVRAL